MPAEHLPIAVCYQEDKRLFCYVVSNLKVYVGSHCHKQPVIFIIFREAANAWPNSLTIILDFQYFSIIAVRRANCLIPIKILEFLSTLLCCMIIQDWCSGQIRFCNFYVIGSVKYQTPVEIDIIIIYFSM